MSLLLEFIATGMFVGKLPFAPGTFGTLLGIPLVLILSVDRTVYLVGCALLFFLGWASAEFMVRQTGQEDPEQVVVDEILGYALVFLFVEPTPLNLALGFFLFRVVDILKPFPVGLFESFPGGLGVMLDDTVGGLLVSVFMYLLLQ
ncbi:MAG: phosphatidylglycerophosphatase A [Aquificae bacterium]|nr:phosphatidylglycerophosphatase A [Aquificota bacterium]